MSPRVTAILVVHRGGDRLQRSLDALARQRRRPDALVIVAGRPSGATSDRLAAAGATHLVMLAELVPFGEAVAEGERVLEPAGPGDALWLLPEDAAPDPEALDRLMGALETAPSVGLVGPKLVEWERHDRIVSLGRSITRFGTTVELVDGELDQGQEDERSDVLAVAPAGMLVRHELWTALGGFDPGLPFVDDGLDLGIRARLAGNRVAVVPEARVAFAGDGVADAERSPRARVRRRTDRRRRTAALHRRLAYAPAGVLPLHWLSLLPLAIVRSIWRLIAKNPGAIPGELAAALAVMFGGTRVGRARGALKRARRDGWSAIAPLRVPGDEVRRRHRVERDARRAEARGRRHEVQFLGTGGGWVLLGALLASAAMLTPLLGFGGVAGGGLLPLSGGLDELWRNAGYGWRDLGVGFTGPADPFAGVLALVGTLAFWAPPVGLTLLWVLALPAAALGAWFLAARLSDRGGVRAAAAVVWAIAPPFLTALSDGRPGALLAHVLLPWLGFAVLGAARSWASAGAAALLLAGVVAAAPSLAPVLVVAWLVALAISGRGALRLAWMPLPALALALPLVVAGLRHGGPLGLLADPGLPLGSEPVTIWQLVAGFPAGGWGGWTEILAASPFGQIDARVLVVVLLAPFAIVAFASLLAPRIRDAALALTLAAGGFATAVAVSRISVETVGAEVVPLWTGAGLSLGWLGLTAAAVVALRSLPRLRGAAGTLVAALVAIAVLPLGVGLATGSGSVRPLGERSLPAFVTAEAERDPRVTTLRMTPQGDGGLRAVLEHGAGTTLDDQSTLWYTGAVAADVDDRADELAVVAGNLASRSGFDANEAVDRFGVRYVLLSEPDAGSANTASRESLATETRARLALDANPALVPVGDTGFGRLWRLADSGAEEPAARIPADAGGSTAVLVTVLQLVVLLGTLLLSIPVGAAAQTVPVRPTGRERRRAKPERARRRTPVEVESERSATIGGSDAALAVPGEGDGGAVAEAGGPPGEGDADDPDERSEPAEPASDPDERPPADGQPADEPPADEPGGGDHG